MVGSGLISGGCGNSLWAESVSSAPPSSASLMLDNSSILELGESPRLNSAPFFTLAISPLVSGEWVGFEFEATPNEFVSDFGVPNVSFVFVVSCLSFCVAPPE